MVESREDVVSRSRQRAIGQPTHTQAIVTEISVFIIPDYNSRMHLCSLEDQYASIHRGLRLRIWKWRFWGLWESRVGAVWVEAGLVGADYVGANPEGCMVSESCGLRSWELIYRIRNY